jgi:hypothetical protein
MCKGCTDVVVVIKKNVQRLKIRDPTFQILHVKGRNTGGGNSQLVVLLNKNTGIKMRS